VFFRRGEVLVKDSHFLETLVIVKSVRNPFCYWFPGIKWNFSSCNPT